MSTSAPTVLQNAPKSNMTAPLGENVRALAGVQEIRDYMAELGFDHDVEHVKGLLVTGQIPGFRFPGGRLWRSTTTLIQGRINACIQQATAA